MRDKTQSNADRGQAYTLEGFVSAMIVLMAILFAMQSVVIAPTTGGLADRTVQAQLEQEAQDALVLGATADEGENLSTLVRYWNESEGTFHGGVGADEYHYEVANDSEFTEQFALGEILYERYSERGLSYNVELIYQNESGEFVHDVDRPLVKQGQSGAVTASYTVTLYESDNLTAGEEERLRDAHGDGDNDYPIPPATGDPAEGGSEIYNVVEVRVSVW